MLSSSDKRPTEPAVYAWRFWYMTGDRVQYYYIADVSYSSALLRFFKWVKIIREISPGIRHQERKDAADCLGEVCDPPGTQGNTARAFRWRR